MGYEFMLGRRPYIGKNRKEIRDQILAKQAGIRMEDLPKRWSIEAADFINKVCFRCDIKAVDSQPIRTVGSQWHLVAEIPPLAARHRLAKVVT